MGTNFLSKGLISRVPTITQGSPDDLESWERNETLAQMHRRGIDRVRGWIFARRELDPSEREHAFTQVCHKFDLCLTCGRNSHFQDKCFARTRAGWALH